MRIAFAVPDVGRLSGNRLAFSIAAAAAREHEVVVVSEVVSERLVDEARALVAPARFEYVRTIPPTTRSGTGYFLRQLRRGPDRELARRLRGLHEAAPFDAVVVFANEGRWLGEYLGQWPADRRPLRCLCILELIDHAFLMAYGRSHPVLRTSLYPAYAVLHAVERRRIAHFEQVACISDWSARVVEYLYGMPAPLPSVAAIDLERFRPPASPSPGAPYLAVPTAGIAPDARGLVAHLAAEGIPLVAFGPEPLPGVPHRGFVTEAELIAILAGAAATLYLFEYEALGLVPLESLAVGTPVVTYPKQGVFSELSGNPNVRFAVSEAEIATAARAFLAAPKTAASVAACRQSVARFAPANAARTLLDALRVARDRRTAAGPR